MLFIKAVLSVRQVCYASTIRFITAQGLLAQATAKVDGMLLVSGLDLPQDYSNGDTPCVISISAGKRHLQEELQKCFPVLWNSDTNADLKVDIAILSPMMRLSLSIDCVVKT